MAQEPTYQALLRNMTSMTESECKKLGEQLDKVPVNSAIKLQQWFENIIIPSVEKKHGVNSVMYKNFKEINTSLIWAIRVMQFKEMYLQQLSRERFLIRHLFEENNNLEQQLLHYITEEDIIHNMGLQFASRCERKKP